MNRVSRCGEKAEDMEHFPSPPPNPQLPLPAASSPPVKAAHRATEHHTCLPTTPFLPYLLSSCLPLSSLPPSSFSACSPIELPAHVSIRACMGIFHDSLPLRLTRPGSLRTLFCPIHQWKFLKENFSSQLCHPTMLKVFIRG